MGMTLTIAMPKGTRGQGPHHERGRIPLGNTEGGLSGVSRAMGGRGGCWGPYGERKGDNGAAVIHPVRLHSRPTVSSNPNPPSLPSRPSLCPPHTLASSPYGTTATASTPAGGAPMAWQSERAWLAAT